MRISVSKGMRTSGEAATSRLAELKSRFQGVVLRPKKRRKDYRGERLRVNLRVSEEVGRALEILKAAGGLDKNSFCERAIGAAAAEELKQLRNKVGGQAWKEIVRRVCHAK
jgi:trans-2-enoyl-CoA reductase